jgi:hypothetical protein
MQSFTTQAHWRPCMPGSATTRRQSCSLYVQSCPTAVDRTPQQVVFNSFIHALMYSFYCCATLRVPVPKILKKSLTTLQILQFIVGGSLAFSCTHFDDTKTASHCSRHPHLPSPDRCSGLRTRGRAVHGVRQRACLCRLAQHCLSQYVSSSRGIFADR